MLKKTMELINNIEGYKVRLRELHWSTESHPRHTLTDDIISKITDTEDTIAECAMGLTGTRIKVGELKPMLPNSESLQPMLKEFTKDVLDYRKNLSDNEWVGMTNIIDDLLQDLGQWRYLATFK